MANVRQELQNAINELSSFLKHKERIEIDIAKQRRKVAAWQELLAAEEDEAPTALPFLESLLDLGGLTDAVRTVLRGSRKEWMNTSEIMTALRELNFPLEKYKAPMASITTTVNRLVPAEVAVHRLSPGANEYKWVGPVNKETNFAEQLAAFAESESSAAYAVSAEILKQQENAAYITKEIEKTLENSYRANNAVLENLQPELSAKERFRKLHDTRNKKN